ncbi:MAG: folylpolyglutamate synthase/dihydrofolate synthase family protein [Hyphomonadaceae bacterium]
MNDPVQQRFTDLFGPEFGHGKPFDLKRLGAALEALGSPQLKLPPIVHVAGTNGKGSVIAFMRSLAEAMELRVHTFSKPHLFELRERFEAASKPGAEEHDLIAIAEEIARADASLTHFDAQVAAAFLLFSRTPADLVLLETGMGGRDDSTNIIANPAATVITPIGIDHREALGPTLADIASHKAGVIKPGAPVIVARQQTDIAQIIEAEAGRVGAPLFRQGVEWDVFEQAGRVVVQTTDRLMDFQRPALHGRHQIENAGLAVAAFCAMDRLPDAMSRDLERALSNAFIPGRLMRLRGGRLSSRIEEIGGGVWVDGGHNAHAAAALAQWTESTGAHFGAVVAVIGMRARKDAGSFLAALGPGIDLVIAAPLSEPHIPPKELAEHARKLGLQASAAPSLGYAMKEAARSPEPLVLICGSFLLAAEALALDAP